MRAFHNSHNVAAKYIARVLSHYHADHIVQGTGAEGRGDSFRGCSVGCTLHDYNHSRYPEELGIPVGLAYLQDQIHETLDEGWREWPADFLAHIPTGADLSLVWPRMAVWLLDNEIKNESGARVASLYRRLIAGDSPSVGDWNDAEQCLRFARNAGDRTAEAAELISKARFSEGLGYTVSSATWSLRLSHSERRRFWRRCADKLLELLATAPVAP